MLKHVGILTSGGDCPGLNAAIRGVGKAARDFFQMEVVGFRDGFRGLVHDRTMPLESSMLSGIIATGGTILGTSRDKPHQMDIGGEVRDMTGAILDTYKRNHLDALICIGGGGTQKNALHLKQAGLNVITLPKTIDNDIARTDVSFGFDTALGTATDAIDRLHSTATSHHRIIVVEVMGHRAGWLALGAGTAGGADVILVPEIPYDPQRVAEAIRDRSRAGKLFSIVAVAEGAMSKDDARLVREMLDEKQAAKSKSDKKKVSERLDKFHQRHLEHTMRLTQQLEKMAGQESRLTILGHLQRGGSPSAADRLLATRLGTSCAELLSRDVYGVMVAARGEGVECVPLEEVAGQKKLVPPDHPWVQSARLVGTSFGD
jgi:ATP-dependent phosphofructokinase / diphosphate-dependent phosphofructokinase